ncbi:MAG: siphovirus ReqiPepy6 Gp37-like family protein [Clostridia bacterium]|nr:siphovirus ReqiPepy6 Gp37-like family protein [Clostridia bacterium]
MSVVYSKPIQIIVFKLTNDSFEQVGEVNQFDSLIWPDKFNGYSQFELWAPITEENSKLFVEGNILWCRGENAAIIEIVKSATDSNGDEKYNIKGRTLEMLLTTRILWGTYTAVKKKLSAIMYELVDKTCVNPANANRKIPFLELAEESAEFGSELSIQKTGGELYDALVDVASVDNFGFAVIFDPWNKRLIFKVIQGVDRSINQSVVDPVVFDTDFEDIITSSYYRNTQDVKSVALVAGEGEATERKIYVTGDNETKGFNRRELYIDARDIQSTVVNEDGTQVSLSIEDYMAALKQRGDERMQEHKIYESFDAQVRVFGNVQYEFGKDYAKGDKVTVRDKRLNVTVSAQITETEEDFDDEYALLLTFGFSYPTLMQKVKRQTT